MPYTSQGYMTHADIADIRASMDLDHAPTPDPDQLQARVTRGIAWLDQHLPDWWRTDRPNHGAENGGPIDPDALVMSHSCYCVLGQLLGNYYRATDHGLTLDQAVAYGFDTALVTSRSLIGPDDDVDAWMAAEFDALTALWRAVIEQRRAEP